MSDTVVTTASKTISGTISPGGTVVITVDIAGCRRISGAIKNTGATNPIDSSTLQFMPLNDSDTISWTDAATDQLIGSIAPGVVAGFRQDVCEQVLTITLASTLGTTYFLKLRGTN